MFPSQLDRRLHLRQPGAKQPVCPVAERLPGDLHLAQKPRRIQSDLEQRRTVAPDPTLENARGYLRVELDADGRADP